MRWQQISLAAMAPPALALMAGLVGACASNPTQAAQASDTPLPATPTVRSTLPPSETPPATGTPGISLQFAEGLYSHPSGLFAFHPPAGWGLEADAASVHLRQPEDLAFLRVQATNTGVPLNEEAFARFVSARSENLYGRYRDSEVRQSQIDVQSMRARVTYSYLSDRGPIRLTSEYRGAGQAVFALDFWSHEPWFDSYWSQILPLLNDIQIDPAPARELPVYGWVHEYVDPGEQFRLEVPVSWGSESDNADFTAIQRFQSPDLAASIDIIRYDDGSDLSKREAALIVQTVLNLHYAPDLRIVGDEIQPDGSERLTWISPAEGISGRAYFELRDSTLVMLIVHSRDEYAETYAAPLQQAVTTFTDTP
jgi:hypothetical protein